MKTFNEFITETAEITEEHTYEPVTPHKTGTGHKVVGVTMVGENKGANILKHKDSGKYFASGGSSNSVTAKTTYHDSPEAAAKHYHSKK